MSRVIGGEPVDSRRDLARTASSSQGGSSYFQQLLQYSAERLSKEPDLLKTEQERLKRNIVDTAVGRYRTFLHAAETIQAIHSDVGRVEQCLESLEKVSMNGNVPSGA